MVPRDRLAHRLSEGSGRRLTVVAAPAGFGKTSLLASWFEQESRHRAGAWVTIDRQDNDTSVLWSYLREALYRACPGLGDALEGPVLGTAPVLECLLPRLVNALAEESGVLLVLDDYHLLTHGPARESIGWLVEHAPPSFQLVLSTRREPDVAMPFLRAHGDLVELRADDLRFSSEEAESFLNDSQLLGLSGAEIELLVERTGGWPAGLYLAALSLRNAENRHALVTRFSATNRHVVDFLESEVMAAHSTEDRDLLVRCSVLERLSGRICDALLGRNGAAEDLRRLSRTNLFLTPLDDDGDWYRFHPLFAQLLRIELEREGSGEIALLHGRAYEWHRDHGDVGEAIEHALRAGMVDEAADLVGRREHALQESHSHALRALELEGPGSPWRTVASWAAASACRSLIAGAQGRGEDQEWWATASLAIARAHGVEDGIASPTSAWGALQAARERRQEALPSVAVFPSPRADQDSLRDLAVVEPLTERERTVLSFLAGDLREAEIGHELFVSHSTVHSHVKSIYRKLGASSRREALERAAVVGYLEPADEAVSQRDTPPTTFDRPA